MLVILSPSSQSWHEHEQWRHHGMLRAELPLQQQMVGSVWGKATKGLKCEGQTTQIWYKTETFNVESEKQRQKQ